MMVSPFTTFFRGAALPMASDLAGTPVSGLAVQACGDAHLSNFRIFNSAELGVAMFDVNDFDETLPGPWEWDVEAAGRSLEVGGPRQRFRPPAAPRDHRKPRWPVTGGAMRDFAGKTNLDVWYAHVDSNKLPRSKVESQLGRASASWCRRNWPKRGPGTACRKSAS